MSVKVIAGQVGGVKGPISQPATDPTYLDVGLNAGAQYIHELPDEHAAFMYVYEGSVRVGEGSNAAVVRTGELAVLGQGALVRLAGDAQG